MRQMKQFLLVAAVCLVLLGIGLYASNSTKVHEWLRTYGSKEHAPDEIIVRQRTTIALPVANGEIRMRIGDIKRGARADIEILGPGLTILAANRAAEVGDRISFKHQGQGYEVHVLKYQDEIGSGDFGVFRVIQTGQNSTSR